MLVHGLGIGGAEVVVSSLTRWLRGRNAEVEVGCLDEVGTLGEELRKEGVSLVWYQRKPGKDILLPWRIARHLRGSSIDVIHAHQMTPFVYGMVAKFMTGVPLILTEHGRLYPDVASARRRAFNRIFGSSVDRITAVSGAVLRSLVTVEGFRPDVIEVLYNGVDVERLSRPLSDHHTARRRIGVPPDARVIGTVGRLHPDKNYELLLRATAILRNDTLNVFLVIVGAGPEEERLRVLAGELGLSQRTVFLGERRDIEEILPAFDVFALPSRTEGTPVTLLEAMAAGIPIVATAVGGVPELLDDGREALLVRVDASSDQGPLAPFAAALSRVLTDAELRCSLIGNARSRARRSFSRDAIFQRYQSLYDEVLAERRRSE